METSWWMVAMVGLLCLLQSFNRSSASSHPLVDEAAQTGLIERLFDGHVVDAVEEGARSRREGLARQENQGAGLPSIELRKQRVEIHSGHVRHHEVAQNDVETL